MAARLTPAYQTFNTANGSSPLAGGKIHFYVSGSVSTNKDTFSDSTLSTANTNPLILDSAGRVQVNVFGSGNYKMVVADSTGTAITTFDPVSGGVIAIDSVANIAALKALTEGDLTNGDEYDISGHTTQGDGGQGRFYWNATSTATDNNGTIVAPTTSDGTGRWIRMVDDLITVKMFGATGNGTTDDTVAIQLAIDYVETISATLLFPEGNYKITDTTTGAGGYSLQINSDDVSLIGEGRGSLITYVSSVVDNRGILITGDDVTLSNFQIDGTAMANKTSEPTANCVNITFQDCNRGTVNNIYSTGGHYGIYFENTEDNETNSNNHKAMDNICFNGFSAGIYSFQQRGIIIQGNTSYDRGTDGFKITGVTRNATIVGNVGYNNTRDGFDFFSGTVDSTIADNVSYDNVLFGFELKGTFTSDDYVTRNITFSNNVADSNGQSGFSVTSVRNSTFVGNIAISNTLSGYAITTTQGCMFSGCTATRNTQEGFEIGASVSRISLVGCYAIDNSWDNGIVQNGTYDGFAVASGSEANFVGCQSINGTTANKMGGQGYGFSFVSSGSFMTGCNALDNVTGDIENIANVSVTNTRGTSGIAMNSFGAFASSGDVAINGYVNFTDQDGNAKKLATIA